MSVNAVSACVACGARVPLGFKLCKDCDRLNLNAYKADGRHIIIDGLKRRWQRKRVKAGLVNTSQYFPMMYGSVKPVIDANGMFVSKLGRFKTYSAMCSAGAKHGNNLARTARFAHYGKGSRKITEFFKK